MPTWVEWTEGISCRATTVEHFTSISSGYCHYQHLHPHEESHFQCTSKISDSSWCHPWLMTTAVNAGNAGVDTSHPLSVPFHFGTSPSRLMILTLPKGDEATAASAGRPHTSKWTPVGSVESALCHSADRDDCFFWNGTHTWTIYVTTCIQSQFINCRTRIQKKTYPFLYNVRRG